MKDMNFNSTDESISPFHKSIIKIKSAIIPQSIINIKFPMIINKSLIHDLPGILPPHDPIDIIILLHINDVNTMINLYISYKYRFSKLLDDPYILNQISPKFKLNSKFINFKEFIRIYKSKGFPRQFGIGQLVHEDNISIEPKLPYHLRWNPIYKKSWLNKLLVVQITTKEISRQTSLDKILILRNNTQIAKYHSSYISVDGNISWDDKYIPSISADIYIPDEQLFDFINYIYESFE